MQKRSLGLTGLEVSVIGLGTVKFGRNEGVKYPHRFTIPTDQAIRELLNLAADAGINLLDTAPAYGESEARLGKLLPGSRHDWVIVTKVGESFVNGESAFDFSFKSMRESIETSLRRLKTDYVDAVLVHSNGEDERLINEGIFIFLKQLKAEGKIRSFGMSTKTIRGGMLTVEQADMVMVTHHPTYVEERCVIDFAREQQKGVLIKKALASGHLSQLEHKNPVPYALQFSLSVSGVSSIVLGTINPTHLREAIESVQTGVMSGCRVD